MFCENCGSKLKDNDIFCTYCGEKNSLPNINNSVFDKTDETGEKPDFFDVILIAISFLCPLFGLACYFIKKDNKYVSQKIKIATITGACVIVVGVILGIVLIVGVITSLAPYIEQAIESSKRFFEIF